MLIEGVAGLPGLFTGFCFGGFAGRNDVGWLGIDVKTDEVFAAAAEASLEGGLDVGDGKGRIADEQNAAVGAALVAVLMPDAELRLDISVAVVGALQIKPIAALVDVAFPLGGVAGNGDGGFVGVLLGEVRDEVHVGLDRVLFDIGAQLAIGNIN